MKISRIPPVKGYHYMGARMLQKIPKGTCNISSTPPYLPNTLMVYGVRPTWPITATPASMMAVADATRLGLPPGGCCMVHVAQMLYIFQHSIKKPVRHFGTAVVKHSTAQHNKA